jgi:hypothetical protein
VTTAEYTVDVEGGDDLRNRLRRYPQIAQAVLVPAMKRSVIHTSGNVKDFTPVYMSRLVNAIGERVESIGGEIKGVVHAGDVKYAVDMEVGPPAGRWPNMEALRRWAHLVLGDADAAPAIARALFEGRSRVQRRPYAMFAKGWKAAKGWVSREFRRARDEIVRRLAGGR